MNKKILVIEDWDAFLQEIETHLLANPTVQDAFEDIVKELKSYKQDVIGFEAEYTRKNAFLGFSSQFEDGTHLIGNFGEDFNKWQGDDEIQVFILKPKKPEVKGEDTKGT